MDKEPDSTQKAFTAWQRGGPDAIKNALAALKDGGKPMDVPKAPAPAQKITPSGPVVK